MIILANRSLRCLSTTTLFTSTPPLFTSSTLSTRSESTAAATWKTIASKSRVPGSWQQRRLKLIIQGLEQDANETPSELMTTLQTMFSFVPGDPVSLVHAYRTSDRNGWRKVRATFKNTQDATRIFENRFLVRKLEDDRIARANIFRDRNGNLHKKLQDLQREKPDRTFCILANHIVDVTRDENGKKVTVDLFDHTKTIKIFNVPESREENVFRVVEELLEDLGLDHCVRCAFRVNMKNYEPGDSRVIRAIFDSNEAVNEILSTIEEVQLSGRYEGVFVHPMTQSGYSSTLEQYRPPLNPDSSFFITNCQVSGDRGEQLELAEGIVRFLNPENTPKIENVAFYKRTWMNRDYSILNVQLDSAEAVQQTIRRKERLVTHDIFKSVYLYPYLDDWKSIFQDKRPWIETVDPKRKLFIGNLPAPSNSEESEAALLGLVNSLFSSWEETPKVLDALRVWRENALGRRMVRVTLETENDVVRILGKEVSKTFGHKLYFYGCDR
eukprot:sb/3464103/